MAKELERSGLPTAIITSLPAVAQSVGTNRIVYGSGVMHPVGDPNRPLEEEKEWRLKLVETTLATFTKPVTTPTVFRPIDE